MIRQLNGNRARYLDLDASTYLPEAHEGRFARSLIITIMTALGTLLYWAAMTPVNEITTGKGLIRTQALLEQVQHPDGGIVATLDVAAGQRVKVGTRLLAFDTATLGRELEKLEATHQALAAEFGRITFVLEGKGTIPAFDRLDELSGEELLFWAEQSYLKAQLDLIDLAGRSILPTIDVLNARQQSLSTELDLMRDQLHRNRAGQKSGAIARNAVEQLAREVLQTERTMLTVGAEILAQRTALETNRLQKVELLARRQREAALRRSEIEEKSVNVAVTKAEIESRIARAQVTATVSGTIMSIAVSHPREVVAAGDIIAQIVPDHENVEAEIEISADRIGSVERGMQARLKVLSYDFTRYGEILGEVASISPFSYENSEGLSVFRVTIALPDDGTALHLANRRVLPGMTVTADILSDSKKVLSYLLKPVRALSDRAFTEA